MSLSPIAKHTGQESGGGFCKIFKFWSFLQSKSINNVCKLLQLLSPRRAPWTPLGLPPQTPALGLVTWSS